jgi:hypothetical protein
MWYDLTSVSVATGQRSSSAPQLECLGARVGALCVQARPGRTLVTVLLHDDVLATLQAVLSIAIPLIQRRKLKGNQVRGARSSLLGLQTRPTLTIDHPVWQNRSHCFACAIFVIQSNIYKAEEIFRLFFFFNSAISYWAMISGRPHHRLHIRPRSRVSEGGYRLKVTCFCPVVSGMGGVGFPTPPVRYLCKQNRLDKNLSDRALRPYLALASSSVKQQADEILQRGRTRLLTNIP